VCMKEHIQRDQNDLSYMNYISYIGCTIIQTDRVVMHKGQAKDFKVLYIFAYFTCLRNEVCIEKIIS
jgi:hypothetical protein